MSFLLLASCTPKLLYGLYIFLVPSYTLPYSQTSLWTVHILGSLLYPPLLIDNTILSHSSSPFGSFLPFSPISYGWQPLFWHVPYFIYIASGGGGCNGGLRSKLFVPVKGIERHRDKSSDTTVIYLSRDSKVTHVILNTGC